MTAHAFPKLVLFDLDGTLLDSAPDMLATVNRMRAARGRAPMPLHELRPHVSKGSRAMSAAASASRAFDSAISGCQRTTHARASSWSRSASTTCGRSALAAPGTTTRTSGTLTARTSTRPLRTPSPSRAPRAGPSRTTYSASVPAMLRSISRRRNRAP